MILPQLPQNIMANVFYLHACQTLYQSADVTNESLAVLESIFPKSQFLKTEKALLCYHANGTLHTLASFPDHAEIVQTYRTPSRYSQLYSVTTLIVSTRLQTTPTSYT